MEHKPYIKVDQAYYGEVQQGHGCISSSIEHQALKTFLTGFTDRPGSLPAGLQMAPYFSGIAYDTYYVFTHTVPDINGRRAGMVLTHALIIKINDLSSINNLETLFNLFKVQLIKAQEKVDSIQLESSTNIDLEVSNSVELYIAQAAKELLTGSHPVIFCGKLESFKKILSVIWKGLPLIFRQKLSFTAGFSETNLDTSKTFIYFQPDLANRLRELPYISDINNGNVDEITAIENFILSPSSTNELNSFITALGVNLDDWSVLQYCAKACNNYQYYVQLPNDTLKQLIRQVAKVSPMVNQGSSIKADLLKELKRRIDIRVESNLKSLRNLPVDAYRSGNSQLEHSVLGLIRDEFKKESNFNTSWVAEFVTAFSKESVDNWCYKAVRNAFIQITSSKTLKEINNIWSLICFSNEAMKATFLFLPTDIYIEKLLIQAWPKSIPKDIAEQFSALAQQNKWFQIHAYLLQVFLGNKEALKRQLILERKFSISSLSGSHLIEKNIEAKDLLSLAMDTEDDFCINAYANRSKMDPTVLEEIMVENNIWLHIWSASLSITNNLQNGIKDLSEKIIAILTQISKGISIPLNIIKLISESSYADISAHSQRISIWKYLPMAEKPKFLHTTANRIITSGDENLVSSILPDHELSRYIKSDQYLTHLMSFPQFDITNVLTVYEIFDDLTDMRLANYIQRSTRINDLQALRLGELILKRGFRKSARQVFENAKSVQSFRFAISKCKSLLDLGMLEKLFYGDVLGELITSETYYKALIELACELYDKGPEDHNIWERAGGDVSKLHQYKTREENWHYAISLLKYGGGGKKITFKSLIKAMQEDYRRNELTKLYNYFNK